MDCSESLELITDDVDGELIESRSLDLMRHLVKCDGCRSEYSELLSLSEMLSDSAPDFPMEVPENFSTKVMALIADEIDVSEQRSNDVVPNRGVFEDFLDKARAITFPSPSLSWSFAASLMLVASLTFFYNGNNSGMSPQQMMTDAKVIKAQVLKRVSTSATGRADSAAGRADSDFNYYVKRHVSAMRGKPTHSSRTYGGAVVSQASFETGALRAK